MSATDQTFGHSPLLEGGGRVRWVPDGACQVGVRCSEQGICSSSPMGVRMLVRGAPRRKVSDG